MVPDPVAVHKISFQIRFGACHSGFSIIFVILYPLLVQLTDMKFSIIIYVFLFFAGFPAGAASSARPSMVGQADERNLAIEMFHSGNFGDALPIFQKLSNAYPSDYLLKYFTGACLVETGNTGKEAEMNLLLAVNREVPSRIFYYLGRLYHMKEDWDNALRFYNRFRNNSTEKEAEELNMTYLSELAYEHKNPFKEGTSPVTSSEPTGSPRTMVTTPEETTPAGTAATPETPDSVDISRPSLAESILQDTIAPVLPSDTAQTSAGTPDVPPAAPENPEPVQSGTMETVSSEEAFPEIEFIRFTINPQVTYLTEDFFQVTEAWEAWQNGRDKEREMEHLMASVEKMRKAWQNTADPGQRNQQAGEIIQAEREILRIKSETDLLYQKARQLEQQFWSNASQPAYNTYLQAHDSLLRMKERMNQKSVVSIPDLEMLMKENQDPEDVKADGEGDVEEKEDTPAPDEVVYKVQLGSFTGAVPSRTRALFDKISKIRTIETFTADDGATVYTTGHMKTFIDAQALQNQVRLEGVKDAFVIAILNEKRISLPEAKKITQEE